MKRNENKEFQSQVIFSPKLSSLSLKMKLVTKLGLEKALFFLPLKHLGSIYSTRLKTRQEILVIWLGLGF
jgi:hypothetical protein